MQKIARNNFSIAQFNKQQVRRWNKTTYIDAETYQLMNSLLHSTMLNYNEAKGVLD